MDFEGSDRGPVEILSQYLSAGTEEKPRRDGIRIVGTNRYIKDGRNM
jgi:hypothetical protein